MNTLSWCEGQLRRLQNIPDVIVQGSCHLWTSLRVEFLECGLPFSRLVKCVCVGGGGVASAVKLKSPKFPNFDYFENNYGRQIALNLS